MKKILTLLIALFAIGVTAGCAASMVTGTPESSTSSYSSEESKTESSVPQTTTTAQTTTAAQTTTTAMTVPTPAPEEEAPEKLPSIVDPASTATNSTT